MEAEAVVTHRSRMVAVTVAVLGNALEHYDSLAFVFFAPSLARLFFPTGNPTASLLLTFATFGLSFVARPLGSVILGGFGDRHGVRRAMVVSIAMATGASLLLAILPSAATIGLAAPLIVVAIRLVQSFSVGGEFGASTSLLIASNPARSHYLAAQQQTSQIVGIALAAVLGWALGFVLHGDAYDHYAFRIVYGLGAAIGAVGLLMRTRLAWAEADDGRGTDRPFRTLLAESPGRLVLGATMLAASAAQASTATYLSTYAATLLGMRVDKSLGSLAIAGLILIPITWGASRLTERLPRMKVMGLATTIELVAILPLFLFLVARRDSGALTIVQLAMVLIAVWRDVCGPSALAGLFPRALRVTGLSVSYTAGMILFGAFIPAANTYLIGVTRNVYWPAFLIMAADVVSLASFAIASRPRPLPATGAMLPA